MKRILFALIALVLNLAAVSLRAQNPGGPPQAGQQPPAAGEVTGIIVAADSSGPAARPAVALRNKSDSKMVTRTMGPADGTFRIQALRPGGDYRRVSGIRLSPLNTPDLTISA